MRAGSGGTANACVRRNTHLLISTRGMRQHDNLPDACGNSMESHSACAPSGNSSRGGLLPIVLQRQIKERWSWEPEFVSPAWPASTTVDLPDGRKRALEIATTLSMEPELMLLDEPTQGMGHEDVHRVTELIKKVSSGRTILMVEHNMAVVSGICDRITVLQRGAVLAEGSYEDVAGNAQVMEAYMGSTTGALEGAH